jgi:superfamily II DNA or RNA helicase
MELHIDNVSSRVAGLSDADFLLLRKALSYRLDRQAAAYVPNPANHVKYLIDKKGNFPTGLMHRVMAFSAKNDLQVSVKDLRSGETALKVPGRSFKARTAIIPYQAQVDALRAAKARRRGVIQMPTGTGKSFVIAMLLNELKLRTLIVVPTLELKSQLTESLSLTLTSMEGIVVENIDSTRLQTLKDFDCLILDEVHHGASKTYRNLNKSAWAKIRWRYGFSATPFRNNPEEQLLYESVAGEVLYQLEYKDAVRAGYIVPVEAYYIEVPKRPVEGYSWAEVYKELVVGNTARNVILARLGAILPNCLTLVKEIAHGQELSMLNGVPFANGVDEGSRELIRAFSSGKIPALIATEGVCSEGVDTRACSSVIIAGLGKAKTRFLQSVGRAVRNYPGKTSAKVFIVKDPSHKWCKNHFSAQKKILTEEYQIDTIKIEI